MFGQLLYSGNTESAGKLGLLFWVTVAKKCTVGARRVAVALRSEQQQQRRWYRPAAAGQFGCLPERPESGFEGRSESISSLFLHCGCKSQFAIPY